MRQQLQFKRYEYDGVTSLSAILRPHGPLCGIYILEFDDGTEYVGQSVDFLARFSTHRRHQEGCIAAFSFAEVRSDSLDDMERRTIQRRTDDGADLRNSALVRLPRHNPALDLVVDRVVQEAWLNNEDLDLVLGDRTCLASETEGQRKQFARLSERSDYPQIVTFLADYLEKAVPWPHRTEGAFWTVTAHPATARSSTHRRVAAISINNVEVLVCYDIRRRPTVEWNTVWFVNLDRGTRIPLGIRLGASETGTYATVGRVRRLYCTTSVLESPPVAIAARRLAMGLLRKGQGMMARYHNPLLADALFVELERRVCVQG